MGNASDSYAGIQATGFDRSQAFAIGPVVVGKHPKEVVSVHRILVRVLRNIATGCLETIRWQHSQ